MSPRLDAIGVVVSDLARSLAFYGRLGLEFPEGGEGHVEASAGGVRVMLDTEETMRSFDPGWQRPERSAVGLAFLCDSAADVDRVYAELLANGGSAHKEPWDAVWGQRYAQVRDPDGNPIDLFAPL